MTLDEARALVGHKVAYVEPWAFQAMLDDARAGRSGPERGVEHGVITSVNDYFVFVRYGSNQHSKATRPEDLVKVSPT